MATTDFTLSPVDFSELIKERTEQFTRREWVLKGVNDWLTDRNNTRVFLLTGEPGSGKTAIAARIVQMHLGNVEPASVPNISRGFLSYFHFCQRGLESTLSPLTFVQSLATAMANRAFLPL